MLKLKIRDPNYVPPEIDQSWTIIRIAEECPPRTWEGVFKDAKYELIDISNILDEQEQIHGQYYPLKKNIFNAFNITPLHLVKVVIMGMDPYHQSVISPRDGLVPRAQGLSFSVAKYDSIPSSLQNIYKELKNSYKDFVIPNHGDLSSWAEQGVLLLNMGLSVRSGQAGSHGEIWHGFVKKVCKAISLINPNCIYLLWGRDAQKSEGMVGEKSVCLQAAHPSGLSANKGFFGCNHFNLTNEILIKQGKSPINWNSVCQ